MAEPFVLFESLSPHRESRSWRFSGCREVIDAGTPAEVLPAIRRIEAWVAKGFHAAGFLSYEAAPAFDRPLAVRTPCEGPLMWYGIFERREEVEAFSTLGREDEEYSVSDVHPAMAADVYMECVRRIRKHISSGDCYQANLTFPLRFAFRGSHTAFYRGLCRAQRAPFCAFIDTGRTVIASASPELFFRIDGRQIVTRPMKGTACRAGTPDADRARIDHLRASEKERAENVMIVDLIRNDLGRVCATGSVKVLSLFDVERYETVHQMTSTVAGTLRDDAGFSDVLTALFPCGSVTGAPKRRSMEIIAGLEAAPRGIYTGTIGFLSPGPEAVFSVAIRTAVIEKKSGNGTLGIGSGITWDSDPAAEHAECMAKARFLSERRPAFRLIETMRAEQGECPRLQRHLVRLESSASYFGFAFDGDAVSTAVRAAASEVTKPRRLRLLLDRNGTVSIEDGPIPEDPPDRVVAFASDPMDSGDIFLYHKTTLRVRFDREKASRPDLYDVLFVNERGEVTEGTFNTVAIRRDGKYFTPPVHSGLLPGVMREALLVDGMLHERILTVDDVRQAEEVLLINALRGVRSVRLSVPEDASFQGGFRRMYRDSIPP